MLGAARLTDGLAKAIPSYAAFVAAETARSTGGVYEVFYNIGGAEGTFRTTLGAASDSGVGSPWQQARGFSGAVITFIRHSFPSEAAFNAYRAAGRMVAFTATAVEVTSFAPVSRNGFATSSASGDTFASSTCADFRYYDNVLGPVKMNPFAGTGPTPYTLGT